MKSYKYLIILLASLLMVSCGIFPKNVEYGQKKIEKVPEETPAHKETQKEAAKFIEKKTGEVLVAAAKERSSTNIVNPASDAHEVAESLSGSLGKPKTEWERTAKELSEKLDRLDAKLDKKLEDFKERNDAMAGKKVEATGWLQLGYFTNLLFIVGGILLIWFILKVVAMFNPPVQVGMAAASVGVRAAKQGLGAIIHGLENAKDRFKTELKDNPEALNKVLEIIRVEQEKKQTPEMQDLIRKLTNRE